jgi:hypothetical protein
MRWSSEKLRHLMTHSNLWLQCKSSLRQRAAAELSIATWTVLQRLIIHFVKICRTSSGQQFAFGLKRSGDISIIPQRISMLTHRQGGPLVPQFRDTVSPRRYENHRRVRRVLSLLCPHIFSVIQIWPTCIREVPGSNLSRATFRSN